MKAHEKKFSAKNFVKTLWYFAKVILQDAVYLQDEIKLFHPEHGHPLFRRHLFDLQLKYFSLYINELITCPSCEITAMSSRFMLEN